MLIQPGETRGLTLQANLNPTSLQTSLRLALATEADVDARFLDGTGMLVRALLPDAFPMASDSVAIRSQQLEESFINYPNPFAAGRQTTQIEYFLAQDAEVGLKIYSITGEPVRLLVDDVRQSGNRMYRCAWDGRNGAGQVVLNGVYFSVLTVKPAAGGERKQAVLKIAVVK